MARRSELNEAGVDTTRREFLQVLVAGSSLMIGGVFLTQEQAAALPGPGNTSDVLDLGDTLVAAETPYKYNLTLEVTPHNRVRFELPREDKGQGIATALAMMVAEEMDADYDRVDVELADRRADRTSTITGGSSTIRTMWEPARTVAANARLRLVTAASLRWGVLPTEITIKKSLVMHEATGRAANFGELSAEAAALVIPVTPLPLKPLADYTIIGTSRPRKNAHAIVTGAQKYTMDLRPEDAPDFPANARPAVVLRPPDIKGRVAPSWSPPAAPAGFSYLTIPLPDRGPVDLLLPSFPQSTGVAVVGPANATFFDVFEVRDALVPSVVWEPGPLAGTSDANIRSDLQALAATLPLTPVLPVFSSLDATFEFPYVAHAPLEVMNAVAHVQGDSATIWYPSQTPNYQAGQIATALGIPEANVTIHIPFAGGAFGRHLFGESAIEAALLSQALGAPIRLMWTRNDDMRHGRFRPMTQHKLRAIWLAGTMLSFDHRVAAAEMDLRHGYGDLFLGPGYNGAHIAIERAAFNATVSVPYEFGVTIQTILPQRFEVPTCSWRSIYSGFTNCANEIFVDRLALAQGADDIQFRLDHLAVSTSLAAPALTRVLQQVQAKRNAWGPAPAGHAYGVAAHPEYRSAVAYLVQMDVSDPANPRLERAFAAIDVGIPINPKGLEAQVQGALIDGYSVMIRASNHLDDGTIREGSFSDFLWARMNHSPKTLEVYVFPADPAREQPLGLGPGGAGELGLPPGSAACVNAYSRATGTQPYRFPILDFLS
jgi:isoquinoline 1-oxidoreductase subunit beta